MDSWKERALKRKEYRQSPADEDVPKHRKSKKYDKPFLIEYRVKEGEEDYSWWNTEPGEWRKWWSRYRRLQDAEKAMNKISKDRYNDRYVFRIRKM